MVDGLNGLADAIGTVFPRTTVQTSIVHLIRNSLDYAGWKDRKAVADALRPIYAAACTQAAEQALQALAEGPWGAKCPMIVAAWPGRPSRHSSSSRLTNMLAESVRATFDWKAAMKQVAILFGDRFTAARG